MPALFLTKLPVPRRPRQLLPVYLALVGFTGWAVLASLDLDPSLVRIADAPAMFAAFVTCVMIGELLPIKVPGKDDEVTTSTCFMYALLIAFGLAPAALAQAAASITADVAQRKALLSIVFNAGQCAIALAAAALVLTTISDLPHESISTPLTAKDMFAVVIGGAVFFAVNNLLAGIAWALATETPIASLLRDDLAYQAWTAALLLGFAPIVIAVSSYGLFLVPLLLLPVLAIHRGSREARISEYRALHDRLTDLPNRVLFYDRAQRSIDAAQKRNSSVAVLILDLDRFKEVNDTLGHHHGDLLLQEVGPRLRSILRDDDVVGRMGGDEFAIMLPEIEGPHEAEAIASRLLAELGRPFIVGGVNLAMQASIGIACYPDHGDDVDSLIQRADVAMYVAKSGHTHVGVYTSEQDPYSKERLALIAQLREALDDHQLVMHYQPQVDLGTGRLTGVEALVRWNHPTRGILYPDAFIPLAEMTGLIPRVTEHALRMSIEQSAAWRRAGLDVVVAVNVSSRDLHDRDLPRAIERLLREHDVPAERLMIEITESMLMLDPERALQILEDLNRSGVGISVDDFGTGYSSLAYLKRLPLHKIKIDRSFVMNMVSDESDRHIVASTIDLGRNLGLDTVAEGVEDRATYEELARLGCEQAQGYHLSAPLTAEALEDWARRLATGDIDLGLHREAAAEVIDSEADLGRAWTSRPALRAV